MGGYLKFKKNVKGENLRFVTRNEAAKKLQVSLQVFRKLCILKGIHPRNPKKKLKGHNKTYYFSKDIRYLQHERLISVIRERRAAKEKATKLKSRKEWSALSSLREKMPDMNLDHIVRERYPTFKDALKDLDDCLSLVHLFANLDASSSIKKHHINICERLSREFQYYVMKTNSLKKVFVSVKGVYLQAEIQGETITWLTPLNLLNKKERNVDYSVMINFLEFYETLMKFVNYRLFTSIGIEYPLSYNREKLRNAESFSAIVEKHIKKESNILQEKAIVQKKPSNIQVSAKESKAIQKVESLLSKKSANKEDEQMEVEEDENQGLELNAKGVSKDFESLIKDTESEEVVKIIDTKNLFKGYLFYLSRETPKTMLEFIITSFGGQVTWDGGLYSESDQKITHQVVDRKSNFAGSIYPTREYIQPQWIFDTVNNGIVLPYQEYHPTVVPPPHLSPFTVYDETSYIPQRKAVLDALINQKGFDKMVVPEKNSDDEKDDDEDMDDDDEDHDNLLDIENKYLSELQSEKNKKSKQVDSEEEDNDEVELEGEEEEEEDTKMQVEEPVKKSNKRQREEEKKKLQQEEETKLAEMMLKKKDKWIYKQIKNSNTRKQEHTDSLAAKRKLIESGKDVNAKERAQNEYVPKLPHDITRNLENIKKKDEKEKKKNTANNNNKSKSNTTKPTPAKKLKSSK